MVVAAHLVVVVAVAAHPMAAVDSGVSAANRAGKPGRKRRNQIQKRETPPRLPTEAILTLTN